MAEERIHIIPLRREFQKVPRYKRAKKAIRAIREFSSKHTKVEDVRIGRELNLKVFERGRKHPPHKIAVKMVKFDEETPYVRVDLVDVDIEKLDKSFKDIKEPDKKAKKEVEEKKEEGGVDKDKKKEILEHAKLEKPKFHEATKQDPGSLRAQAQQQQKKIIGATGK